LRSGNGDVVDFSGNLKEIFWDFVGGGLRGSGVDGAMLLGGDTGEGENEGRVSVLPVNVPSPIYPQCRYNPHPSAVPTTNPQLDYAPPLSGPRHRYARRLIRAVLILVLAIWLLPRLFFHAQVLWWQHECLNYTAPADKIVYDDTSYPKNFLPTAPDDHSIHLDFRKINISNTVECLGRLHDASSSKFPLDAGTLLYLHARRNPAGDNRLVAVILTNRLGYQLNFSCLFLEPASPISAVGLGCGINTFALPIKQSDKPLRLYAAQSDLADPTRFTIRYDIDGQQGIIEGKLETDSGITLKVLDGPALQRTRDR
jgi:hypothetical protein